MVAIWGGLVDIPLTLSEYEHPNRAVFNSKEIKHTLPDFAVFVISAANGGTTVFDKNR